VAALFGTRERGCSGLLSAQKKVSGAVPRFRYLLCRIALIFWSDAGCSSRRPGPHSPGALCASLGTRGHRV